MSASEWQRLERDIVAQPALRDALDAALAPCRSREEAMAVLRRHGYAVGAESPPGAAALSDDALDQVTGGVIHNPINRWIPFDW